MARKSNIASTGSLALALAPTLALALVLGVQGGAAFAQPVTLEDLIPDSAVADPEGWAKSAEDDPAPDMEPELDASSALDSTLDDAIEWPDAVDIPELVELEPEEGIDFAAVDMVEQPTLTRPDVEQIDQALVLALPSDELQFPVRSEFIDLYRALSSLDDTAGSAENLAQVAARARADEALLSDMLRAYGYYDAQVIRSIGGDREAEDRAAAQVRFDVIPGPRYRFGAIDLGQLSAAADAEALRAAFGIVPGDALSSFVIEAEQADLELALAETGYAFATIEEPELLVDHARIEGDLTMPVAPGGKYAFGEVTSNRPRFLSGKHLASIARFRAGDVYQRSLETDLRRAITATGLVSSVTVARREVTPPMGDQPGVVALDVTMEPARLRTVAGAIGYGSEEGFRLEASWEHRNFFPPEGAVRVRGIVGTQEQMVGATFRRNNLGGRDKVLTADAFVSTVDNAAFDSRTAAVRVSYERLSTLLFQKPLSWSLGGEVLIAGERNQVAGERPRPRQTYRVASLFARATIDSSDSLLDPRTGFRVSGFIAPEFSRTLDTDYFYVRAQADASAYIPASERIVMAGRVRAATVQGAPLEAIAPSRRLYAGGGTSVRGYAYQAVGPKTGLGDPTGGRSLVEASLEARVDTGFFDGALQVVPFVDAASVSVKSVPDFSQIKFGAGIGIRYKSSFGPIRVDVGVPINPDPADSPVAVYVSLGQAF